MANAIEKVVQPQNIQIVKYGIYMAIVIEKMVLQLNMIMVAKNGG
jgi:hypothetical protein